MNDPDIIARDALRGVTVGLSVSESSDLARLGLTPLHCQLVVAEIARAVVLAGGTIAYGGRLKPEGFTAILLDQAQRYQDVDEAFRLYVPEPEYRKLTATELSTVDQRLGSGGSLRLISATGTRVEIGAALAGEQFDVDAVALTMMRQLMSVECQARVVVGGKLEGFEGAEPGVIEEARLAVQAGSCLYLAAGYGGAAAALARTVDEQTIEGWAPPGFPRAYDEVEGALIRFQAMVDAHGIRDGLTDEQRKVLRSSHRPADIATTVIRGLATAMRD